MQAIKCLDCPTIFTPKAANQTRCPRCSVERRKEKDRERKKTKPVAATPQIQVAVPVIAPASEEIVTRVEPIINEDVLSAMTEPQRQARIRAHRAWKEQYGAIVKTPTVSRPTEVQISSAELAHIASEPQIYSSEFYSLSETERSQRLKAHQKWEDSVPSKPKTSSTSLDYLFSVKKPELPVDPFLQEIQNTDAEHLTVFQTPNGALYDRLSSGGVRESKLRFLKGQWFSKIAGLEWEPLFEGSTVVVVKVPAIPSLSAQLQQKPTGEWEWFVPQTKILNWPVAYLTKSKAMIFPDGSPAHLRSRNIGENFDIYGRTIFVLEIADPPFPDFIISDEGHYIRKSYWAAKDFWMTELTRLINDIEKREVDKTIYAPTLAAWKAELELLQNNHFSLPKEVVVEPPTEQIKLPPIAEEPPQRSQPAPPVEVLDTETRRALARSLAMDSCLEVSAAGGDAVYYNSIEDSCGYLPPITTELEIANRTVISTDPAAYRQQRRDIARARKRSR